jgi:hypothetical protein
MSILRLARRTPTWTCAPTATGRGHLNSSARATCSCKGFDRDPSPGAASVLMICGLIPGRDHDSGPGLLDGVSRRTHLSGYAGHHYRDDEQQTYHPQSKTEADHGRTEPRPVFAGTPFRPTSLRGHLTSRGSAAWPPVPHTETCHDQL